jgi:hypothetical protein
MDTEKTNSSGCRDAREIVRCATSGGYNQQPGPWILLAEPSLCPFQPPGG